MSNVSKVSVLVVDDHPGSLEFVSTALQMEGVQVLTASNPEDALEIVYNDRPQVLLTDLVMPGMTGMELLERVVEFDPSIQVVLMTAHYSTESAVEAIRKGACDYLDKPIKVGVLRERVGRLLEDARQMQRAGRLEQELLDSCQFEGIVGRSPLMWEVFSRIRRIAPHFRTALITGETGTGKDLIARGLHKLSSVSTGRFVALNCSAVVETLLESELFGHVRGAFTGAVVDKAGLFEHAHGGVLFLDEVGDMSAGAQSKLLRALQNQEVQRVGSVATRKVDVRVIAATHRDLRDKVSDGSFREDLFYRLSMIEIRVPSLRDRKEDLPLLERYFVKKYSEQFNKEVRDLTQRAHLALARHNWPGNVRELENVIGHASMMTASEVIDVGDLPDYLVSPSHHASGPVLVDAATSPQSFEEHERHLIADALARSGGNQSEAARMLRIGRDALRYKIKKHNLT
jgi:DNA-binding NtrC family response regulator